MQLPTRIGNLVGRRMGNLLLQRMTMLWGDAIPVPRRGSAAGAAGGIPRRTRAAGRRRGLSDPLIGALARDRAARSGAHRQRNTKTLIRIRLAISSASAV